MAVPPCELGTDKLVQTFIACVPPPAVYRMPPLLSRGWVATYAMALQIAGIVRLPWCTALPKADFSEVGVIVECCEGGGEV